MYFEQMLFPIPQTQDRATSSNYSQMTGRNWEEDTDERREDEQGSGGGTYETSTYRKQQRESNISRKINYKQQLLDILKEKSEHIYEDKTFLLSLVPGIKKLDVLGKDENAGHFEESQKYGISATICAVFYSNDFFTTDI
jgi:hypothetical protein